MNQYFVVNVINYQYRLENFLVNTVSVLNVQISYKDFALYVTNFYYMENFK